jgi:hypothetical protein
VKGLNFAVTPHRIPFENIITGIESGIDKLTQKEAETIRQKTCNILRSSKLPKPNITHEERQAIKKLNSNDQIIVLPADKGNTTVILDKNDYDSKITSLLSDTSTYKIHNRDPITYLEKTTKSLIMASPSLDSNRKKCLIPREKSSRMPKFYGLPKVHKDGAPLRPIVSAINSPTQPLAKYLAWRLQPHVIKSKSFVKNSEDFIQKIQDIKIEEQDILVSFDVVSLFTNIPTDEAVDIIKNRLEYLTDDIITLISHCLNNTYFTYKNTIYKQIRGTPMGSSLSPGVANLFMSDLEERLLQNARLKPAVWLRYMDDTFVVWKHGREELDSFLNYLNTIHPSIKFTMEVESNDRLAFLDVLVYKRDNGTLGHTVYRKPTHTDRYLNADSHHHPAQIASVAHTLVERARRLADPVHLEDELNTVKQALEANGFPRNVIQRAIKGNSNEREPTENESQKSDDSFNFVKLPYVKGITDRISRMLRGSNIRTVFTAENKISSLLQGVKDKIPLESHGVYEVPCGSCDLTYVGRTNRKVSARIAEHMVDVKNKKTTSTLATHVMTEGHTIDFEKSRVLASLYNEKHRVYREAIEIEARPTMNARDDALRLPLAWKPLIPNKNNTRTTGGHPSSSSLDQNINTARVTTDLLTHNDVSRSKTKKDTHTLTSKNSPPTRRMTRSMAKQNLSCMSAPEEDHS